MTARIRCAGCTAGRGRDPVDGLDRLAAGRQHLTRATTMASIRRKAQIVTLGLLVVLWTAGCGLLGGLALPPELAAVTTATQFSGTLPSELQFVMDNKAEFAASTNVLAGVTPGTVRDDLANLTGCWGSYEVEDPFQGAVSPVEIFEAYHFDAAAGTAQHWAYTSAILMMPAVYAVDEGTYTVDAPGRITITVNRYSVYDLSTGQGRTVTNPPAGYFEGAKLATLSGDSLSLADPVEGNTTDESGAPLLFRRFACP
jgi:hypothetical protein